MDNDKNNNKSQNSYITLDTSKYNITRVNENEDTSKYKEVTFKLIVIGDIAVGKSSIIQCLVNEGEKIKDDYQATIGFDIFKYKSKVNDIVINLNIWDTCGLIDFSACTPSLFKNANIALVVYAIDKKKSFENLDNWINCVKSNSKPDTEIFIVGNKNDLEDKRQIKIEEGIEYAKLNNYNFFIETSAKEQKFVKDLFEQAIAHLYEYNKISQIKEDEEEEEREDFSKRKGTFTMTKEHNKRSHKSKNKGTCCIIF